MSKVQEIHNFLRAKADPCVDQAFAQALPTADQTSLTSIATALLQRKHALGNVSLIEQYHRLPESTQRAILHDAPELTKALRIAMSEHKTAAPANALHIIHQSGSVRLVYLIPDQLRHGPAKLKDEAAKCLLEMALRTTSEGAGGGAALDAVEAGFVITAVRDAIRFFGQHQRKDVLLAMLSLPLHAVTQLLKSLEPLGKDWTHPTGVTLTRSDTLASRQALLPALSVQPLHPFALDGIRICQDTHTLADALKHWHLLKLRRYRIAVKRIRNKEQYIPDAAAYEVEGPAGHTAGLVAWLSELPMESAALVRELSTLNQAADEYTRLLALRKLLTLAEGTKPEDSVHHAIAGYCADKSPPIVRIALTHLIRCHYPDITKVLAQLVNSPDPQIQRIAGKRLAPVAFAKLWDSWPKLSREQQIAAGRALIKIDPNFHAQLHDKMCLPDPQPKIRAMSIISELNQGLLLEDKLRQLSRDSNPRVVASAIKALGSADPVRNIPLIERALESDDDRVRANAVEALAKLGIGQHADLLVRMTHETESNRTRANAIHALMQMQAGDALQALSRMLNDTRAAHRASALWLVEEMGVTQVARDVAEMSISEPDKNVRKKAARVINHIIDQMTQPLPFEVSLDEDESERAPAHEVAAAPKATPSDKAAGK